MVARSRSYNVLAASLQRFKRVRERKLGKPEVRSGREWPSDLDAGKSQPPYAPPGPLSGMPWDRGPGGFVVSEFPMSAGSVARYNAPRCQLATLADQARASPRVVERMVRHSSLAMTDRYTRPRMHDMEGAAATLPSLRGRVKGQEAGAATGTERPPVGDLLAHHGGRNGADAGEIEG